MNKDKKVCFLFKDLYPSYIDEMVEEETKLWMDRHLEECPDCSTWRKNYKVAITPNKSSHSVNEDTSTFEEDKKTIRKAKIVITLGLVAVIMLALWTSVWMFV